MERILSALKRVPGVRALVSFPLLRSAYHTLWAFLGNLWYRFPSRRITVVGVTGTKGKTSVLELLNAMLEAAGKRTALISSLRVKVDAQTAKNMTGNSMPGRAYLPRFLDRAARTGCEYALVEVTSEGVRLNRHRFVRWRYAAITNLAPEHIESHGSFEKYRDAKAAFLVYAGKQGAKVAINKEAEHADYFLDRVEREVPGAQILLFSKSDPSVANLFSKLAGSPAMQPPAFLSFEFNQANVAAAVTIARDTGVPEVAIERALESFKGVPGRMEFVQTEPFRVVVDYAHTPDSLEKVYAALKPAAGSGRLICVLGSCGGGRDRWKRPVMGKVAAGHCDEIILTNEDPYDEPVTTITSAIAEGFKEAEGSRFQALTAHHVIPDRAEAVAKAVSLAKPGDTVVLTGKGSEAWIHVAGGRKVAWNEREAAEKALAAGAA